MKLSTPPPLEVHQVRYGGVQHVPFTSYIEKHTSQVPSSLFLAAAIGAIGGSLILKLTGKDKEAQFVGQWVSPFLLLGIYNKLVKQHGSDADVNGHSKSSNVLQVS